MAQAPTPDSSGELARALSSILVGAAIALALAPALVLGLSAGFAMRRYRLRFTWALAATPILALPLAVAPLRAFERLRTALDTAVSQHSGWGVPVLAATPFWLAIAGVFATVFKLWRDRRDRLHGGVAETASRASLGPLQILQLHRERADARTGGRYSDDGILLGHDDKHRRPVRLPLMQAHATIVGGSNSGKTNTAEVLLEGAVAAGAGFVILDGKGGRDLPRAARALAAQHQRPLALWSVLPYGDPDLDSRRLPWNVAGGGNHTEITDRISNSEEQTEPYYKKIAARGISAATRASHALKRDGDLAEIARALNNHEALSELLHDALEANPNDARLQADLSGDLAWLDTLDDNEKSGLRGMGLRLNAMHTAHGGEWLLPDPEHREINLYEAIKSGWLVVFTLPQGTYPELIPDVTRYVVSAVNAVVGRLEREGTTANCLLFVDELSAFNGDQLCSTLERARSAGIRCVLSTQSLSNFEDVGGTKLLHAALDNSELIVVHRQAVPEAADVLASVAGTEEVWEHTHKVDDAHSFHMGMDEVGERARRLSDRFRIHPNTVKQLGKGEAVVISQRPEFAVTHLQVEAGLSALARHREAAREAPARRNAQSVWAGRSDTDRIRNRIRSVFGVVFGSYSKRRHVPAERTSVSERLPEGGR